MSFVLTGNLGSGPGPSGDLATDILVRRVQGSGSGLVEVTVAVPEDLSPSAQFNIDGWAAQSYRISDRARRVIALVPGDSPSWPRQSGVLRVAVGEGQVPSEAGTFPTIDLSAIKLILGVDGTQYEAGLADAIHTNVVAPIGPGHRGQVGPDLLRREHYLLRLKRQGVSGPGTETTDYVTVADVHVTRRVDKKVVEFIVHWMNGAWRSTDNTFQPSPASSGHVFFDFLRIATASIPTGYAVEMFAPHPTSFANEANIFMVASAPANEVHGIYPGGQSSPASRSTKQRASPPQRPGASSGASSAEERSADRCLSITATLTAAGAT